jgi:putative toxin-antitoxin system antitoxin component (TIGR02293 family)
MTAAPDPETPPAGWRALVGAVASPALSDRLLVARAVRDGMPFEDARRMEEAGLLDVDLLVEHGVIPRRTWTHARKQGALSAQLAQRVTRWLRIAALARETFGDDKARRWLTRPTDALGGAAPVALLDTEEGARAVELLMGRIAHGIAA